VVQSRKDQDKAGTFVVLDHSQEISSPESMTNLGRDVIGGIQPRFMYECASPNYYEPMEHRKVDENTNVDMFEESEENYPRSKYAEAHVNVLDEVS